MSEELQPDNINQPLSHKQADMLCALGMGEGETRQWLSDTWLLAERRSIRGATESGPMGQGPGGFSMEQIYQELEALECAERASVLQAVVRFAVRHDRLLDPAQDRCTPAGQELRAAALDLVLPCAAEGQGSVRNRLHDHGQKQVANGGPWPTASVESVRSDLAARLLREGRRPVSERLFGPRGPRGRVAGDVASTDDSHKRAALRDGPSGGHAILAALSRSFGSFDSDAQLDGLHELGPPLVGHAHGAALGAAHGAALWGLAQLAATLDPGLESAIAALECRLVLGEGAPIPELGPSIQGLPPDPVHRLELAGLVASGQFGKALDRSSGGEFDGDQSSSLGALRSALRHRVQGPSRSDSCGTALQNPRPGEIHRISRFLDSFERAWPDARKPVVRESGLAPEWVSGEIRSLAKAGSGGAQVFHPNDVSGEPRGIDGRPPESGLGERRA